MRIFVHKTLFRRLSDIHCPVCCSAFDLSASPALEGRREPSPSLLLNIWRQYRSVPLHMGYYEPISFRPFFPSLFPFLSLSLSLSLCLSVCVYVCMHVCTAIYELSMRRDLSVCFSLCI